jgi:hypothetical protein
VLSCALQTAGPDGPALPQALGSPLRAGPPVRVLDPRKDYHPPVQMASNKTEPVAVDRMCTQLDRFGLVYLPPCLQRLACQPPRHLLLEHLPLR